MNQRQKLVQQQFLNNEKEVLNRLKRSYGQAQHDVNAKIKSLQLDIDGLESLWEDFDGTEEEAAVLKSRIQSKIYQKKYQEAIKGQVDGILNDLRRNAYENISEYLEKCYDDGFIGTMFDLQGQGIPMIMPIDQEAVVRAVQLDSKISKGLYTRMGEEVETLKKTITNEVTRGIVNGMSYAQVAQQIKFKMTGTYDTPGGAMYRAQTIARTEGHRIQTAAAMDACYNAKEKGADVVKQWDATLDDATRESHVNCDGEIRELDKPFSNGLMFPGDPAGGPGEVVNCRCALLQRARWAVGGGFTKYDNFSGEIKEFDSLDTYNDFKKAYFSKENRAYMNYVGELESQYKTKDFNKLLGLMDDDEYSRFVKLQDARPMFHGVYRGDDVIKKNRLNAVENEGLTNISNSATMKLPDIQIGTSVGAKANTYDIMDLKTGEIYHLVEGSRLQDVEVFAGKGSNSVYRNAYKYADMHGGKVEDWQHCKGKGLVATDDGDVRAELHWSQCEGIGKFDFFVKEWLE